MWRQKQHVINPINNLFSAHFFSLSFGCFLRYLVSDIFFPWTEKWKKNNRMLHSVKIRRQGIKQIQFVNILSRSRATLICARWAVVSVVIESPGKRKHQRSAQAAYRQRHLLDVRATFCRFHVRANKYCIEFMKNKIHWARAVRFCASFFNRINVVKMQQMHIFRLFVYLLREMTKNRATQKKYNPIAEL